MDNKIKVKWFLDGTGESIVCDPCPEDGGDIICEAPIDFEDSMKRWEANAMLIKDAGNTFNETGLTPSQLLEQRNQLLDAITIAKQYISVFQIREENPLVGDINIHSSKVDKAIDSAYCRYDELRLRKTN